MNTNHPLDAAIGERLAALPVANISDSLDRLYVLPAAISAMWPGAQLVGPAYTVLTAAGDNMIIHEAIDDASEGDVLVVNGQGYEERALIGELMSGRGKCRKLAGFVINGAIRDRADIEELQFPVFARAVTPAGPYRNGPGFVQRPIAMGPVAVSPGDIIVADADGVVVIPQDALLDVLVRAEAKRDAEKAQRAKIGAKLVELGQY
jgi:RraA family protein